jgi:hypothetical protein
MSDLVKRMPASVATKVKIQEEREIRENERITAALEAQKRRQIGAMFVRLAPVFEHFGIAISAKGGRNPVWTLKAGGKGKGGKVIRVSADGAIDVVK